MSEKTSPDLRSRLREATEEIDREFQGRVPAEVVSECIRTAEIRISEIRIPDYAPIFFGRHARRLLRDAVDAQAARPGAA